MCIFNNRMLHYLVCMKNVQAIKSPSSGVYSIMEKRGNDVSVRGHTFDKLEQSSDL